MVIYFFRKYSNYQLTYTITKNLYFLESARIFFTRLVQGEKQLLNTRLLFFSILSFYTGVRFIVRQQLSFLLVIKEKDLSICKFLLTFHKFDFISENAGIPGILSNNHEILNGERYTINAKQQYIQLKNKPNFLLLCSSLDALVSQEANIQLIPQMAILLSITNTLTSYFIPLFIPKYFISSTKKKILSSILKNTIKIQHYYKQRYVIFQKYFFINKFIKKINYLVYINLLTLIK